MTRFLPHPMVDLYQCDAREIPFPDQSIHCVVTSPPYYGLRVYRAEGKIIGLEQTPNEYLNAMMEVFDEIWRVLRDDGVCWVNLGDSYGGSGKDAFTPGRKQSTNRGSLTGGLPANQNYVLEDGRAWSGQTGQLLMIPARFALRMQERGWTLRDDVIWHKKSAMPESLAGTRWERCRVKVKPQGKGTSPQRVGAVAGTQASPQRNAPGGQWEGNAEYTDCHGCSKCKANDGYVLRYGSWRCTNAHEHIFQFVKAMGYWSDGEAVKVISTGQNGTAANFKRITKDMLKPGQQAIEHRLDRESTFDTGTANRRNVWQDIKPEPYRGEHYATFPSDLPRLCIQGSTSEAGACSQCGAQWARVMEKGQYREDPQRQNRNVRNIGDYDADAYREEGGTLGLAAETRTLGWRPTCICAANKVPPLVLDPFCGTGTTCLAAMRLGRRSVGVDLSADYLDMAVKRLNGNTLAMRFI